MDLKTIVLLNPISALIARGATKSSRIKRLGIGFELSINVLSLIPQWTMYDHTKKILNGTLNPDQIMGIMLLFESNH